MSEFGRYLARLVESRFGSRGQREFIRKAQPGGDEDTEQSRLSKVMRGLRPAPLPLLTAWADALDLTGAEREQFMELAVKSHANDAVSAMIGRLEREAAGLRKEVGNLRAQVADLAAELAKRGGNA